MNFLYVLFVIGYLREKQIQFGICGSIIYRSINIFRFNYCSRAFSRIFFGYLELKKLTSHFSDFKCECHLLIIILQIVHENATLIIDKKNFG